MSRVTAYEAEQDIDTDGDPRDWSDGPRLTVIFRSGNRSGRDEFTDAAPEIRQFLRTYEATGDEGLALRAAQHYAGVFGTGNTVETLTLRGYSQGDWWQVVTVDAGDAQTFGQWLRGDVWSVTGYQESTCDQGHVHRTIVDSLGGIYADDADAAIAYFRANYVDDRPYATIEEAREGYDEIPANEKTDFDAYLEQLAENNLLAPELIAQLTEEGK